MFNAIPEIVAYRTWRAAVDQLRMHEKTATRELYVIAAQRRRRPLAEAPDVSG